MPYRHLERVFRCSQMSFGPNPRPGHGPPMPKGSQRTKYGGIMAARAKYPTRRPALAKWTLELALLREAGAHLLVPLEIARAKKQ
jgi:hypothetical protein